MWDKLLGRTVAAAAAVAVVSGVTAAAKAADTGIVIDQPDLRVLQERNTGPTLQDVVGSPVFGNAGRQIGTIEDFVVARGGYLFAVVDVTDRQLAEHVERANGADSQVVVPWHELRMAELPTQ